MTPTVRPWSETFYVRAYEADPSGHASMQTLCNYLQEAAGNHAQQLGLSVEQLAGQNLTWVLAYLHVEVDRYPPWREAVHIETWPSGENGLYASREFLLRGQDGSLLGRSTSAWLLIDLGRRRPVRLPEAVRTLRVPERPRPFPGPIPKLSPPTRVDHAHAFHVRFSDLDLNQHVNNVCYIEWAVESVPQQAVRARRLSAVEMSYRAETAYPDTVTVQTQQAEVGADLVFLHRLRRTGDEREVALARTYWASDPR